MDVSFKQPQKALQPIAPYLKVVGVVQNCFLKRNQTFCHCGAEEQSLALGWQLSQDSAQIRLKGRFKQSICLIHDQEVCVLKACCQIRLSRKQVLQSHSKSADQMAKSMAQSIAGANKTNVMSDQGFSRYDMHAKTTTDQVGMTNATKAMHRCY